jgi:DNA-binding transcriptional ArsR family regulator
MSTKRDGLFRLPPDATDVELLAKYFLGFGHPIRLGILALIAERERSPGELAEALGKARSQVSNHPAILRWCGFVTKERRGRRIFYRVSDPPGDRGDCARASAPTWRPPG